ncbi:MAG: type pilus assembly protein PilB [Verrucomicrobiota bacterium]|nr:type pilus assembly protein PilB [Verrucomicrobiota bacterium]
MFEEHDLAIQHLLTARRLVAADALQQAVAESRAGGRSVARTLVALGLIGQPALLQSIADHLGYRYTEQLPEVLTMETTGLWDAEFARSRGVVPVEVSGPAVLVAAADPFDPHLCDDLAFRLGRPVRLLVADPEQVQLLLRRYYGGESALDEAVHGLPAAPDQAPGAGALSDTDLEKMAGQPPIVRFVNLVLGQAVRDGASDVHFEPFEGEFRIRCRVDGTLRDLPPPPRSLALPVVSRLKVLAGLNIAERRLPQDGRLRLKLAGRFVDLRVSTLPTQFGESVVLRVLDQSAVRMELGQLGLPPAVQAGVETVIGRPHGIFIVTGPTGCGKTTTLYSCLRCLNQAESKLLTVEDPVEYEIDGVMQVPVNNAAGLTFARALRTFLRQDPDIVMVGEIRDAETARIAIQASLTGHLVLTTLHTNDAASAITRLVDMGIEPFLLASTVEGVLAQRLVRRNCPACREAHMPAPETLAALGLGSGEPGGAGFQRGRGCPECEGTGFLGRVGIFEFLRMTEPLREAVAAGATLIELRKMASGEGMTLLRDAGLAAAWAGEITPEELLKFA